MKEELVWIIVLIITFFVGVWLLFQSGTSPAPLPMVTPTNSPFIGPRIVTPTDIETASPSAELTPGGEI